MKERHYSHDDASRGRPGTPLCSRRLLLSVLIASALGTAAGSTRSGAATLLRGRVVHITDAATFTLRAEAGDHVRVSLAGTTPPAAGSRAAAQARRALASLLFDRVVEVHAANAQTTPLRGRVLHRGVDIAMQMVAAGWLRADGADAVLLSLEDQARDARRGQWTNLTD